MAGEVIIGTRIAAKPSELLDEQAAITLKPTRKYVGRGALKLEAALDHFDIDVRRQDGAGYWRLDRRVYRLHVTTWRRQSLCG